MQALALYPANSMFTSGYLTTDGNTPTDDMQMIRDAGFEVEFDGIEAGHEPVAAERSSLPIAN
jgi:biotin synthase